MDERNYEGFDKMKGEFGKAYTKAEEMVNNKSRVKKLLKEAMDKFENNSSNGFLQKIVDHLKAMFSLIKDWVKGEYKEIPLKSVISIIAAIIYFVSPIDLIPDFIFVFGYVDDAVVVGFVFKAVYNDLMAYVEWKGLELS